MNSAVAITCSARCAGINRTPSLSEITRSPGMTTAPPIRIGVFNPANTTCSRNDGWKSRTNALNPGIFARPERSLAAPSNITPVPVLLKIEVPRLSPIKVPCAIFPNASATYTSPFCKISIGQAFVLPFRPSRFPLSLICISKSGREGINLAVTALPTTGTSSWTIFQLPSN